MINRKLAEKLKESADQLATHHLVGSLFENMVVVEYLKYWKSISGLSDVDSHVVYGGTDLQQRPHGSVHGWAMLPELVNTLHS